MTNLQHLSVENVFSSVMGKIAFSITQSHGSCFFIQFGDPFLKIRDPIEASPETSEKVKLHLRRRQVFVVGTWSLLVLGCDWLLSNEQRSVNQDDNIDDMESLFRTVEGQYLVSASCDEVTKSCTLKFDMGAILNLRPRGDWDARVDADENQWQLHFKDGSSVSYSNNGLVIAESGGESSGA